MMILCKNINKIDDFMTKLNNNNISSILKMNIQWHVLDKNCQQQFLYNNWRVIFFEEKNDNSIDKRYFIGIWGYKNDSSDQILLCIGYTKDATLATMNSWNYVKGVQSTEGNKIFQKYITAFKNQQIKPIIK